jgi:lauroyl/myristoyl acyltransferase
MKAQEILGSPPFILLGMALSRALPPSWVGALGRRIARRMARDRAHLFCTLRANLAHVLGPSADQETLDRMAEEAIYHAGCTYVDMFRFSARDYRRGRVPIRMDWEQWAAVERCLRDERGTVLVGPHVSNFDLASQWMAAQGHEIQGLSLPNPNRGTRFLNKLRSQRGLVMTPLSLGSLRSAAQRLRAGGICMTGADRPISEADPLTLFFGAPAHMPTGHVRLAMQTNARILIACCIQDPDGVYHLHMAPMLELETIGGREHREQDVEHNVRRVLTIIEAMIRQKPEQWLMLVPVWEDADAAGALSGAPGDRPPREDVGAPPQRS